MTIRSYASPEAFKQALEQRLRAFVDGPNSLRFFVIRTPMMLDDGHRQVGAGRDSSEGRRGEECGGRASARDSVE